MAGISSRDPNRSSRFTFVLRGVAIVPNFQ
jgi:hypothetical protein